MITDESVLMFDKESYVIRGLERGESNITLDLYPTNEQVKVGVRVDDNNVEIHKLDPIVATLRLSLDSTLDSRLELGSVTLQVVHGVLFVQEEVVVTASVVFKDGHRSLITDPLELMVNSSNSSIVSVRAGNILSGEMEGEAVITVAWINPSCGVEVLRSEVALSVVVDESRPVFVPDSNTVYVPEDSPIAHNITVVTAIVQFDSGLDDRDSTDVQYRFRNGANFDGLFTLDPASGELVLNGKLDRETTVSYTLYIEATNSAQRRAEGGEEEEEDTEDVVSGSGEGSGGDGGGVLMPEPTPGGNTNISLNIAVLTVSCRDTCMHVAHPDTVGP